MVLSASGIVAICGAALGDFRHAQAALITAVGASTLAVGVSLYFGDFGCGDLAGNGDANARSAISRTVDIDDPFDIDF